MDTLKLNSPAKINLFLDVVRKRKDNYHDIETIFERLDLCDEINLARQDKGIALSCGHPALKNSTENLAYRAASALLKKIRKKNGCGVRIEIKKRIPVAAGLGGGSSNAATVLLGLNKLWDLHLSKKALTEIAAALGADVPFFVTEETFGLGRGRGDEISPIEGKPDIWHILVCPGFEVPTVSIYNVLGFSLTPQKERGVCGNERNRFSLTKSKRDVKLLISAIEKGKVAQLGSLLYNELEDVILNKYKELQEIKDILSANGAKGVLTSGSGPTIFGIMDNREEAVDAKKEIEESFSKDEKRKKWSVFVAKSF